MQKERRSMEISDSRYYPCQRGKICCLFAVYYAFTILRGWVLPVFPVSTYGFWFFDSVSFVVVPAVLIAYGVRHGVPLIEFFRYSPQDRPLSGGLFSTSILFTMLTCLVAFAANIVGNTVSDFFPWAIDAHYFYDSRPSSSRFANFLIALYFSMTAGVAEELMFRGGGRIVWQYVTSSQCWFGYVISSSTLFGLMHWPHGVVAVIQSMVMGVFWSTMYIKINDIYPLIIAHAVLDFIIFV